jgi:UDP-N-acetylmuramoyl-tripeptide--D-alanyl-D-alanine ligase
MTLWTSDEAARATGGTPHGAWEATGVSIDTRTLQPGDLFVALKAARDGHDFVADALAAGAAAALVSRRPDGVAPDAPLLVVEDVQAGLEALGRAARARTTARVVAVTGSVGKTSTKEMLAHVLSAQAPTHASAASYNNHWGVPLTLARMPADTAYAVIEIGMNHPGEIAPLSRMACPHVAMVTTVAPAHLEAFGRIEGIAVEKASIVEGLEPRGTAVLNGDVETAGILRAAAEAKGAQIVSFGESASCHHRALRIALREGATVVEARAWRTPLLFKIATPGRHFGLNGLAALAAVHALGADRGRAAVSLASWEPVSGRGQRARILLDPVETDTWLELIDDAYNANPASVAAALDVLAAAEVYHDTGRVARGRRIAILGDMMELGPTEGALHAGLADLPAMQAVDVVHCVGPRMRALYAALPEAQRGVCCDTAAEMAAGLRRHLDLGDVVLVKGSLSTGLGVVVDAIRKMGHAAAQGDE